jgi:hyperosmotically inducible periplasmic protein
LKLKRYLGVIILGGLFSAAAPYLSAQSDNTKANQRSEPTADQAKNNLTDRDLMQQIRKSVMDDKSLSSYAHNVKIVAQNGKVTLKGPVRSEEEKRTIERKASDVAGPGNVVNEMTVRPPKS